jgi:hypothetical protein
MVALALGVSRATEVPHPPPGAKSGVIQMLRASPFWTNRLVTGCWVFFLPLLPPRTLEDEQHHRSRDDSHTRHDPIPEGHPPHQPFPSEGTSRVGVTQAYLWRGLHHCQKPRTTTFCQI